MILTKNTQRKIKINENKILKVIEQMLKTVNYKDFDIGVWFTTNATIKKYNLKYRKKDKATDILSFPYHTQLKPGEKIKVVMPEDKNLGDIIISAEYVKKGAEEMKTHFQLLINTLLAHGIAHLLGHDHGTNQEKAVMEKMEKKLLNSIK